MSRQHEDDDSYLWDGSGTVDPEVERLEKLLAPHRYPSSGKAEAQAAVVPMPRRTARSRRWLVAAAPLLAAAAALIVWLVLRGERTPPGPAHAVTPLHAPVVTPPAPRPAPEPGPAWAVDTVAGAPTCGAGDAPAGCAALRVGQWLTTDASSRARVHVADIGRLDVAPGSHLRLLASGTEQHRLELERGEIHAVVSAPPRLLIVDTPAAQAVDLGCAYTLSVDDDGRTRLEVTLGWVALEAPGRHVIVPAGARASTRPGAAPSTPVFDDAPAALIDAAARLDATPADPKALHAAMTAARTRDTLTLWHLVPLVPAGRPRLALIDRIEALGAAPPPGVSRAAIARADVDALEAWRLELALTW